MASIFHYCLIIAPILAIPTASIKRQLSDINPTYDFIIAGGGTSGLTVADRLTEAFPNKTLLVIEHGEPEYARGQFDPPDIIFGGPSTTSRPGLWSFTSLPSPEMGNQKASVLVGKTIGGSSAVNGQFFDRPSRADFEAWNKLSTLHGEGERGWDWAGIWPFYKKSVTFTPPSHSTLQKYNYSWDISAYGGTTPIHSSFPPFYWADHDFLRSAWKELGVPALTECAGGDKIGLCWIPTSQYPVTARRSHAGLGHYANVMPRSNYHVLVKHQVVRVVWTGVPEKSVPVVEVRALADGKYVNVTAHVEVIISAGALHTPTILQRSGIGAKSILAAHKISQVVNLPGVGMNLQDHSAPPLSWNYTKPLNFTPLPSAMLDPTFAADAIAGFNETPARGPYTLAMSNSAVYLSLPDMTSSYLEIVNSIRATALNGTFSSYLPTAYGNDPTLQAGYTQQLLAIADLLVDPNGPSIEVPFATGQSTRSILLHPLFRGTVSLNATHPLEQPILDYRAGSNPLDFDIHIAHLRYIRKFLSTPSMISSGAIETAPGPNITSVPDLISFIKREITLSLMHPCCTAAMMPRELGGVVGPEFKVHGTKGLRVVDISVLPILVSAHTSSTAYALGEKAVDDIVREYGGR